MFQPRSWRGFRAAGFLLSLFIFAAPGHAATRCVGTPAQLVAALAEANAANAESTYYIKLRTGDYVNDIPLQPFSLAPNRANQLVEVSGGWSHPSCGFQSHGPVRTTLKGTPSRGALAFGLDNGGFTGNRFHLYDVDLTLTAPYATPTSGACLVGSINPGNQAVLARVATYRCDVPQGWGASIYLQNAGQLTVRNLVVRSAVASDNGGIRLQTHGDGVSRLAQISVTDTQSLGSRSGITLENFNNAATWLSNSVIWGNDPDIGAADLYLAGSGITLTRVHYGKLSGVPAANIEPSTGNPGFVAADDSHLLPHSVLIDRGVTPEGGSGTIDLDGNPRLQGPAVDIGAYEMPASDAIFWNGFDFTD